VLLGAVTVPVLGIVVLATLLGLVGGDQLSRADELLAEARNIEVSVGQLRSTYLGMVAAGAITDDDEAQAKDLLVGINDLYTGATNARDAAAVLQTRGTRQQRVALVIATLTAALGGALLGELINRFGAQLDDKGGPVRRRRSRAKAAASS
jgi:hypothetical protein